MNYGIKSNILFLDIDGVLNHYGMREAWVNSRDYTNWSPEAVELLNELCIEVDAKVVISSTWRVLESDPIWWNAQFALAGAGSIDIIGVTPRARNAFRGREVRRWLFENVCDDRYVIIDDESDFYPDQPRVHVNGEFGLLQQHIDEALSILQGKAAGTNKSCMVERNPPVD